MRIVVIVTFCLLTCSTNTAGNQMDTVKSGEENTKIYKSPLQLRSASENSTESLIGVYQPTSTVQVEETAGSGTETDDISLVLLCSPKSKVILVKKDFLVNDAVLYHICAEGKEIIPKKHQEYDSAMPRISRTKRDVNDTQAPGSDTNSHEVELPKAEPWVQAGPARPMPQQIRSPLPSRPQSIGNILGQQIVNHRGRQPSRDSNLPPSPSRNSRIQPNPSTQLDNKLLNTKFKQDKISEINGKGTLSSGNGISRQYLLADSYSRYPDIPIRHQQNYYTPPAFPSLGGTGISLLNLLNPLNLFRSPGPPPLPIGSNPLPYKNNPLPSNINHLPYNSNHLRHIANPVRPSSYDFRQAPWSQEGHSHGEDPFLERGKIKYEILKDNKKHEFGFEFMEDSQLRDDIYVGKDGNLYIKDDNTLGNSHSNFDISSYAGNGKDPSFEISPYGGDGKDFSPVQNKETSHGNLEELDIEDANRFEEQYRELLKNHNMNEDAPNVYGTHFRDFVNGHREIYDLNSLDYYEGDPFSENKKPNSLREVPIDWVPQPGRINYPTYFYVPRPVVMSPMYRSRLRRPSPPRAGSPSTSNLRLNGLNPLSSFLFPSSISRPVSPGYDVNDGFNLPNAHRKSTNYEDPNDANAQSSTISGTRKMTNAHGFYPGNGFFEADFPTVFQMSPFKQSMEHLSAALKQNGTFLLDIKNSTTTTAQ